MTLYMVFRAGSAFLRIVSGAILVYCLLSWVAPGTRLYYGLERFIRPFVSPFRRLNVWLTGRFRLPLDFSCWFAIIGLNIVERLWMRLYVLLYSLIWRL